MNVTPSKTPKRPLEASPTSPTDPVTSRKRQRRTAVDPSTPRAGNSRTPKTPRKSKTPLKWQDIPKEWTHNRSPFLELPVELLDKITGPSSKLELQDHLALSSTCRTIRDAYTDDVWKHLIYQSVSSVPSTSINRIFSRALEASQEGKDKGKERNKTSLPSHLQAVVELVNTSRITKTLALQMFKISENDLAPLNFKQRRNPHSRRSGAPPMKLYIQAQVRSLTIRIHGGPLGHEAHLQKRAQIAEKTRLTKERNGTTPKKKNCIDSEDIVGAMLTWSYNYSGYDPYEDSDDSNDGYCHGCCI